MPKNILKEKKDNTNLKSAFIPAHLKFLFLAFLSGMILFTLFRLILLWINKSQTEGIDAPVMLYALFNRGCLFDSAVNSYMLSVPFLFFTLGSFITPARKFFYWTAFIIASAFYVFGDGRTTERSTRCLAGYTIGLGLTEAQGIALATAMQAFQAALGRAVAV